MKSSGQFLHCGEASVGNLSPAYDGPPKDYMETRKEKWEKEMVWVVQNMRTKEKERVFRVFLGMSEVAGRCMVLLLKLCK